MITTDARTTYNQNFMFVQLVQCELNFSDMLGIVRSIKESNIGTIHPIEDKDIRFEKNIASCRLTGCMLARVRITPKAYNALVKSYPDKNTGYPR